MLAAVAFGQYWAFHTSAAESSGRAVDLGIEKIQVDPAGTHAESLAQQLSSLAGFDIPAIKAPPGGVVPISVEVLLGPEPAAGVDSRGRTTVRHQHVTLFLANSSEADKPMIAITFANGGNSTRDGSSSGRLAVSLDIPGVDAAEKGSIPAIGGDAYYLSFEGGGSASFARLDTRVSEEDFVAMIRETLGQ